MLLIVIVTITIIMIIMVILMVTIIMMTIVMVTALIITHLALIEIATIVILSMNNILTECDLLSPQLTRCNKYPKSNCCRHKNISISIILIITIRTSRFHTTRLTSY
jgi:hypothetical protein